MSRKSARSWEELRLLNGFRETVDKSEMSGAQLVGEYEMSNTAPMQPCGILQCRTKHRYGFIIELADEAVSHVGRYCGKKHFGTSLWKVRLNAYRQATQLEAKARALAEIRARAASILADKRTPPAELAVVRGMFEAFDDLPESIRDSLCAKAQDRNGAITRSRPPTEKELKDAKFHGRPRPSQIQETVARIEGLKAILSSYRPDHLWDSIIPARLSAIRFSVDSGAEEIFASIRAYETDQQAFADGMREATVFFAAENLEKIALLQAAARVGVRSVRVFTNPTFCIELG